MMEAADARRPDVHARTLADRLEALEDGDVLGVVGGRALARILLLAVLVRHKSAAFLTQNAPIPGSVEPDRGVKRSCPQDSTATP